MGSRDALILSFTLIISRLQITGTQKEVETNNQICKNEAKYMEVSTVSLSRLVVRSIELPVVLVDRTLG